ncbi:hypothetical protein GDO81_024333 [Engystomops pustulosus]|uniref:Uncharacterized protein n=1 Tax=Engystomops pustulosus TaxID=76066 RepID=A0AAV6Z866_ENGPU|nr:hypothetical protein GDO81_024333 [Engystomops pustulosus]
MGTRLGRQLWDMGADSLQYIFLTTASPAPETTPQTLILFLWIVICNTFFLFPQYLGEWSAVAGCHGAPCTPSLHSLLLK